MRARRTLLAAAAAVACAGPLELPNAPEGSDAPHLARVLPDVAIASLGSPLMLKGDNLGAVTDVWVGPIHFTGSEINAKPHELTVHVTTAKLTDAKELGADGEPLPVRVVAAAGSDTALETVRVYADLATIRELAPVDVAPRQLVYLRGVGFDGDQLENNVVALSKGAVDCAAPPAGETPAPASKEPDCVRAKVFWAARGLVIAEVPDVAPSGPVKVIYRNRQFEKLQAAALEWSASGNDMAGFYETPAASAPAPTGDAQADAAAMGDLATTTSQDADVPERAVVWLDPGVVTLEKNGGTFLRIRAEGRLCYPTNSGKQNPRLRVLLDGQPLDDGISCVDGDDAALDVTLPGGFAASLSPGQHALQVVNPYFQSPVCFFKQG